MPKEIRCGCGQRTKNTNGVCDKCLGKVRLLNHIRNMIGAFTIKRKKGKKKYAFETYYAEPFDTTEQLCWTCEKASGKCSWSESFTPIEGWEAKKVKRRNREEPKSFFETYKIKSCPEYEPAKMLRVVEITQNKEDLKWHI